MWQIWGVHAKSYCYKHGQGPLLRRSAFSVKAHGVLITGGLFGWGESPLFSSTIPFCFRISRREHADPAIEELNPGDALELEGRGTGELTFEGGVGRSCN